MKRAVITGFGIISSIGNNKEEVLASLKAGKSGIEIVPEFIDMKMRSHVAGTIKLNPSELIDRKVYRFMGDAAAYAYLSMKEAPRKKINPDDIIDFILIAFPLAIVGARLYYVIFEWAYYSRHLDEIFAVWNGGIAIYGGLLTGALVLYLFSRRRFIEPIDFLDIAAPSVMIAQSIGRWGNFFNQEAYGAAVKSLNYLPTFIRDQMYIDGSYRQPTFLYESSWNLLGFVLISLLRRKPHLSQSKVKSQPFTSFGMVLGE